MFKKVVNKNVHVSLMYKLSSTIDEVIAAATPHQDAVKKLQKPNGAQYTVTLDAKIVYREDAGGMCLRVRLEGNPDDAVRAVEDYISLTGCPSFINGPRAIMNKVAQDLRLELRIPPLSFSDVLRSGGTGLLSIPGYAVSRR